MPNCHQCGNPITDNPPLVDECSYCFKQNVTLCQKCLWFEKGPLPALPPHVTTEKDIVDQLIQPCPQEKRKKVLKKRREKTFEKIQSECDLIKEQAKDESFKNDALKACEIYDHVYHIRGLKDSKRTEELKRQRMFHTLIVIYLSARKKCNGYRNDGPYSESAYNPPDPPDASLLIHRHDAPKVAAKHLETCFFGPNFIPVYEKNKAKASLETLVVERLLREKIGIWRAYKMLKKIQDDYGFTNDDIKEVIKKNAIIYHTCTAIMRTENKMSFDPRRAHGWLLPEHKDKIFGTNPADPIVYTDWAKTKIGTLIASIVIPGDVPTNRWPDTNVSNLNIQGFTPLHKEYLQSLPKFDNTGTTANRSECENEMRNNVENQMRKLFAKVINTPPSLHNIFNNYINPSKPNYDGLLDEIINDMNSNTYWIESSSTANLIELFEKSLKDGTYTKFQLISETALRKKDVNWSVILDKCPKVSPGSAAGKFTAIKFHPNDLKDRVDGRQDAKNWYLDWRHDKDEVIYNCFDFSLDELPNFTSFTPWTNAPEANETYGAHMIIWDPDVLKRAVITLGDWGTPRRSKLMLLRDMLCPVKRMDGSEYSMPIKKYHTFERILLHYENNLQNPPGTTPYRTRLTNQFNSCIDNNTRQFKGDKIDMGTGILENLECHIFGPMIISNDSISLLLCTDRAYAKDPNAVQNKYKTLIKSIKTEKANHTLQFDIVKYKYDDNGRKKLQQLELYEEIKYVNINAVINPSPT